MKKEIKKYFTLLILISLVLLISLTIISPQVKAMANPSAVCCRTCGGDYKIRSDEQGNQYGICIVNNIEHEEWDFFNNNCGEKPRAKDISKILQATGLKLPKKTDDKKPLSPPQLGLGSEYNAGDYIVWDWRNPPAGTRWANVSWLTSVKNQGFCGSCWAFAALGTIESRYNTYNNDSALDLNLSEQELVSCCGNCGDCDGGWPEKALDYTKNNGVVDEDCFNYNGSCTTGICDPCNNRCSNYQKRDYKITNSLLIGDDTDTIKQALIDYGPLSVVIRVITSTPFVVGSCTIWGQGNHAVVLIGYNDSSSEWIIKNSWGAAWNGNGYAKISYDKLCTQSAYPYTPLAVLATETKPNAILNTPANNYNSSSNTITFNCSAQDTDGMNGLQKIILWGNFTGNWSVNQTNNITGASNSTNFTLNLSANNYIWSCEAVSQSKLSSFGENNRTLNVNLAPEVTLNSPVDKLNTTSSQITLNCSATDNENLVNITLYIWNSTSMFYTNTVNKTGTGNSSEWQVNLTANQNYNWSCLAYDNDSLSNLADNHSLTTDTIDPIVNLSLSENNITEGETINISCTVSEQGTGIKNITISYDSTTIKTCISSPCEEKDYGPNWIGGKIITCTAFDFASNSGNDTENLDVERRKGGGGGGGGGSSEAKIYDINEDIEKDKKGSKDLKKGEGVKFKINKKYHNIELIKISSDKITLKISSDTFYATINLSETKQIDTDKNGINDLQITFLSMENNKANLLFEILEELQEKISEENDTQEELEPLGEMVNETQAVCGNEICEASENCTCKDCPCNEEKGEICIQGVCTQKENFPKGIIILIASIAFIIVIAAVLFFTLNRKIKKKK